LKNKDNKHVNGGSSECTVILSVMYHSNIFSPTRCSHSRLIRRVLFVNNGWRELKETTRVKSRNSKQQIHRKNFLLKNRRVFIGRISFVNNGWRELKETSSSNWKFLCQAI
ncbi:hypothetical protein T01_3417, partial [Trichinella spiralis]